MFNSISISFSLAQGASGTGLAFLAFTEAIIRMPAPQLWAVLFFIMLFTLGLSSMFGIMEGILAPLLDLKVFPKYVPKEMITGMWPLALSNPLTVAALQEGRLALY